MSEQKKREEYGAVVGETWTGTDEQIDRNIRANSGADWKDSNTVSEEENMIYLPPLDVSAPVPEGMKEAVGFFTSPRKAKPFYIVINRDDEIVGVANTKEQAMIMATKFISDYLAPDDYEEMLWREWEKLEAHGWKIEKREVV